VIRRLAQAGVDGVILRERSLPDDEVGLLLDALVPLRRRGLRLLVSRRLDLARAHGLDGVHLAADAIPVREARSWLGPDPLIGYSAHSGQEALRAAREGASYVTLSPIYTTDSKPGAAGRGPAWLTNQIKGLPIPALALGGIDATRIQEVQRAGAWGVAAVSALGAASDVEAAARGFQSALLENIT